MSLASDIGRYLQKADDLERRKLNGNSPTREEMFDAMLAAELLLRRALVMSNNVNAIKHAMSKVVI